MTKQETLLEIVKTTSTFFEYYYECKKIGISIQEIKEFWGNNNLFSGSKVS